MDVNKLKKYKNKYLMNNSFTKEVNFFFTPEKRIEIVDVPEGYYRYRIRHTDYNENCAASLEKQVIWNHYPMRRKTPCFSYGVLRHFHRIYASNLRWNKYTCIRW